MIDEYELLVDGIPEDPAMVMFHQQEQPFPGGRSYRMSIRNREGIDAVRQKYADGVHDHLGTVDVSFVLGYVNLLLSFELNTARFARGIRVWINNIQRMEVQLGEVQLMGECSDHVSRQPEV